VNVSKKTASLNPTQSHYDSFEYFLDNLTIFWISEVVLRSARCVAVRAFAAACHVVAHGAKMQRLRLCDMLCVDDEYAALRDQYQTQVGSPEQRLARWVIYAVLAAPIVATLLHDLGVGAVAPWIISAILAAPMIVMLSHREIDVDPLIRWVFYVIITITPVLFWSPSG